MAQAPDFTLLDQASRPWTLSDHLDAAVILVFLRGDWWPYCNGQLVSLAQHQDGYLAAGARIVGISIDSPEQNSSMVQKLRLPFPLLSDPDRSQAIEPYGVANDVDPRNLAHPAVIVVDPSGAEVYREVGRDFADRITEQELLDVVGTLNLPPASPSPIDPGSGEPGPKAMPVHAMIPYFRGARFAAVALGTRHPSAKEDADRYVAQMDRYMESVKALRSE